MRAPRRKASPSAEPTVTTLPAEQETRPNQPRIDIAKALKLRLQGNTLSEIGAVFGVSESAVSQALRKFEGILKNVEPGTLTAFSEHRSQLLNAIELELMRSLLQPEALEKASLNNRAYAFQQVHQARRLEEGKSTENLGVLGKIIVSSEDELGKSAKDKQS